MECRSGTSCIILIISNSKNNFNLHFIEHKIKRMWNREK